MAPHGLLPKQWVMYRAPLVELYLILDQVIPDIALRQASGGIRMRQIVPVWTLTLRTESKQAP
jgi:hypothetical protein